MAYRNPNQRKFLFAMDRDKQQNGGIPSNPGSIPQQKSAPASIPTSHPAEIIKAPKTFSLGMPLGQKPLHSSPMMNSSIKPTASPSLPQAPKIAKFGKVKKFMKGPI